MEWVELLLHPSKFNANLSGETMRALFSIYLLTFSLIWSTYFLKSAQVAIFPISELVYKTLWFQAQNNSVYPAVYGPHLWAFLELQC